MYNSLVVRFLVRIWDIFSFGYTNSFVKKIVDFMKNIISYLFFGSITKDIFVSDKSIISLSIFYRIYVYITDKIGNLIKIINNYIKSIGKNSVVCKSGKSLFADDIELASTIFTFILFFGLGIIGNNMLRGLFSGRSYLIAIGLIILSTLGILLKDRYKGILGTSAVFKFIMGIFAIDEGGANWW